MKKRMVALLIVSCCLTASGQFFSEKETSAHEKDNKAERITSLPEADQKAIFLELCSAKTTADQKAKKMHPIKIHQVPEKREELKNKAKATCQTLLKLYKTELAEKHNISEEYLAKIEETGIKKQWLKEK